MSEVRLRFEWAERRDPFYGGELSYGAGVFEVEAGERVTAESIARTHVPLDVLTPHRDLRRELDHARALRFRVGVLLCEADEYEGDLPPRVLSWLGDLRKAAGVEQEPPA